MVPARLAEIEEMVDGAQATIAVRTAKASLGFSHGKEQFSTRAKWRLGVRYLRPRPLLLLTGAVVVRDRMTLSRTRWDA